jgi:glutamate racemase
MGSAVTLVSSAEETANDVYARLVGGGLARDDSMPAPKHRFLTTGDPAAFMAIGGRFLGPEILFVEEVA